MTRDQLAYAFVDMIPEHLEDGVLYVSIEFRTTMHLCACGCGCQVVLPLRRSAWSMTYNGEHISMRPSVGNWSFDCRSHYWIRDGRVDWAGAWSDEQVDAGRHRALVERGALPNTSRQPMKASSRWRRIFRRARAVLGTRTNSDGE